jgi:hypothetical protein
MPQLVGCRSSGEARLILRPPHSKPAAANASRAVEMITESPGPSSFTACPVLSEAACSAYMGIAAGGA